LIASVEPDVKTISFGEAPISSATCVARLLDRLLRVPAERVAAARGVAEVLGEVGQHRVEHARIERRRRLVVEVDGSFMIGAGASSRASRRARRTDRARASERSVVRCISSQMPSRIRCSGERIGQVGSRSHSPWRAAPGLSQLASVGEPSSAVTTSPSVIASGSRART
jgi:hypothetical protein